MCNRHSHWIINVQNSSILFFLPYFLLDKERVLYRNEGFQNLCWIFYYILSKGFPTSLTLTLSVRPSCPLQLNHVPSQLENSAKYSIKLFLLHPGLQPTSWALPTYPPYWMRQHSSAWLCDCLHTVPDSHALIYFILSRIRTLQGNKAHLLLV